MTMMEMTSRMFGLISVILIRGSESVQRFEQKPSYTEVNPGQDGLLICKVFNKRGFCSWQKDNKPMGMYPNKYEWHSPNQENGDCSIRIRAAQLEFDDGNWECQVTASDFHTQDALTSSPVRFVVRVSPQRPRIEFNGTQVLPGHNLTALHGEVAVTICRSHYGNPPPVLKWFLNQTEITPTRRQTNTTELDNPRTWLALSVLELTISKENHGKMLRCVAVHESYSTKSSSIDVRLDVMYLPETRLTGIPTDDVEDLKDTVSIRCLVNANPRASVIWRREGQTQPASLQELLQFSPVIRAHSGLYSCIARNKAGESQPARIQVDVKYPPKIVSIGRDKVKTASLFSSISFECMGEGNPPPTYQWLQKLPSPSSLVIERSRDSKLYISNVTYDYQGEYNCRVRNIINGEERIEISDPIILQVHGAPQVLRHTSVPEIFVDEGENAVLSMVVCADPRPRIVAWEWGSLRLEAGSEMGRYRVENIIHEHREDCYKTTLHIKDVSATDSRAYYLAVENENGTDRNAVQLHVREPFQMTTVVSLTGGLLVAFLLSICVFIYLIRREKFCFSRRSVFKPPEINSQKLDIEKSTTDRLGIPADAIYTSTHTRGSHHHSNGSPEAMKPTHTFNGRSSLEDKPKENIYSYLHPPNERRNEEGDFPFSFFDSVSSERSYHLEPTKYYSFNPYITTKSYDNWSYNTTALLDRHKSSLLNIDKYAHKSSFPNIENRSSLRSLKKFSKTTKARPRPMQLENEKYYDLVFPKQYVTNFSYSNYQPDSQDKAEL